MLVLYIFDKMKRRFAHGSSSEAAASNKKRYGIFFKPVAIATVIVTSIWGYFGLMDGLKASSDQTATAGVSIYTNYAGGELRNLTQVGDIELAELSFLYMRGGCAPMTSSMAYLEPFLSDHNYSIVAKGENGHGDAVTLWCVTAKEYSFGSEISQLEGEYADLIEQNVEEITARKETLVDGMRKVDGMQPNRSPLWELLGGKETQSEILDKFLRTHRADTCKDRVVLELALLEFQAQAAYSVEKAEEAFMGRCKNQLSADLEGQVGLAHAYIQVKNAQAILVS
jgi:hypothetical protein